MKEEIRILAVNPGSRYTGIAVFHGTELADWGVNCSRDRSLDDKWKHIESALAETVQRDRINCIAVKSLHERRSSKNVRDLAKRLKEWSEKERIALRVYTINDIEECLITSGRRNKRRLMDEIAAAHPFLYPEREKETRSRDQYQVRMFEAVGLGMRCLSDIERSKGRTGSLSNHENKE